MIIVQLIGGLGNQMFQYALGRKLSLLKKVPLKMDISWYVRGEFGKDAKREYVLKNFNITESFATPDEIKKVQGNRPFIHRVVQKIKNNIFGVNVGFDEKLLHIGDDYYIEGYHQSEKYFTDIIDVLQKDFSLKGDLSIRAKKIEEHILSVPAVSLHVRRGDYVTHKKVSSLIGVVDLEYYTKAIEMIKTKVEDAVFFVFSDDIAWVKEHMHIDSVVYVSGVDIPDYEEMVLMSRCKHNIIANSSFSWWGAWLNKNADKTVIAPKQWFKKTSLNHQDLIPDSWIKI